MRIPVNYGVAEENPPFITGMDTLDWAFRTAKKHGIGVLLDLHGVPGSQNGWDHSGRQGTLGWHTSKENIDHSLRIVGDLASRCKGYDNLIGFELLNEPRYDVPLDIHQAVLSGCAIIGCASIYRQEKCAVVIHDAFRPRDWANFMTEPEYQQRHSGYASVTSASPTTIASATCTARCSMPLVERKKLLDDMQKQLPCYRRRVVVRSAAGVAGRPERAGARPGHASLRRCSVDQFRRRPGAGSSGRSRPRKAEPGASAIACCAAGCRRNMTGDGVSVILDQAGGSLPMTSYGREPRPLKEPVTRPECRGHRDQEQAEGEPKLEEPWTEARGHALLDAPIG